MTRVFQAAGQFTVWVFVVGAMLGCASTAAPLPPDNLGNLLAVAEALSRPRIRTGSRWDGFCFTTRGFRKTASSLAAPVTF